MPINILRFKLIISLISIFVLTSLHSVTIAQNDINNNTGKISFGTALHLDGAKSYVEITDSKILNTINQKITISVWIKPIAFPNKYTSIIYKGDKRTPGITNRSYVLFLRNDGAVQFASSPKGLNEMYIFSHSDSVALDEWTHIAGVIDTENNIMNLYVDGKEKGTNDYNWSPEIYESELPLQIGYSHETEQKALSSFIGQIDDVSIWNKAMTIDEIQMLIDIDLSGNEEGLVAYWNFNQKNDKKITDITQNNNDGFLVGTAKIIDFIRPEPIGENPIQLQEIIRIYEKKIEKDPIISEYYRILIQALIKSKRHSDAENLFIKVFNADFTMYEKDYILTDLFNLYTSKNKETNLIEILEGLKPTMEDSIVFFKLLGDTYTKLEKYIEAENAYKNWYKNVRKFADLTTRPTEYNNIAEFLLDKNILPEEALDCALLAFNNGYDSKYIITLGHAFLVNERFGDALHLIETNIESIGLPFMERRWFERIVRTSKNIKDKDTYIEMMKSVIDLMPENSSPYYHATLALADFYQENGMNEKARTEINKTGFITEDSWIVLGPFDNKNGNECKKSYINEKLTKFDTDEVYDGKYDKIKWRNGKDEIFNGYVSLGVGEDWAVGYAYTTVISPKAQKVEFRFDSDDQGKIWLNGKVAFQHSETFTAEIDDYKIPIFLKAGKNSILVKVCELWGGWGFYFRITDNIGNPIPDLIIQPVKLE
ncbi:hypothetical protein C6497_15055 [Candidatus Poribacteria bacterium]|nr:MAG: hypothetical protein C6497_15055 [Candidatus Poribacteria bacterium]